MSMFLIFFVLFQVSLCVVWWFDIFYPFHEVFILLRSFMSLKELFVFVEFLGSSCDSDIAFIPTFG